MKTLRVKQRSCLCREVASKGKGEKDLQEVRLDTSTVVLAVGITISAVVLATLNGLKAATKAIGNGLKALAKKAAAALPGLIGSIVSFIFKAAGQVFAFLGEHAWLLILAVVAFFMERLLKKRRKQ